MSYSVKPCKSEETLKGYWGQLVGVRAARMQINCRLSLLLLCVYVCLCVCVCIATHTHIYIRKRSLFVLWHIFFSCCCIHTSHCKSSFIFHSVDLDTISFQKQGKKNWTSVFLSNMLHICAFCGGSSKFSLQPTDAIHLLVKNVYHRCSQCSCPWGCFLFFLSLSLSPLLYRKNIVTFDISIFFFFAFNSN